MIALPIGRAILLFCQFIAFCDHAFHIIIGDAAIKDDGIPVRFVQMIGRDHGCKCAAPEACPLGIAFEIDPDIAVSVKNPCENFLIFTMAYHTPVRIVKGIILVDILIGQAVGFDFCSCFQSDSPLSWHFILVLPPALPLPFSYKPPDSDAGDRRCRSPHRMRQGAADHKQPGQNQYSRRLHQSFASSH